MKISGLLNDDPLGSRELEFILAPDYLGLTVLMVESDTLGPEARWVITLEREERRVEPE